MFNSPQFTKKIATAKKVATPEIVQRERPLRVRVLACFAGQVRRISHTPLGDTQNTVANHIANVLDGSRDCVVTFSTDPQKAQRATVVVVRVVAPPPRLHAAYPNIPKCCVETVVIASNHVWHRSSQPWQESFLVVEIL
jgi:hypothetical protein